MGGKLHSGSLLLLRSIQQLYIFTTTTIQRTFRVDFLDVEITWTLFILMVTAATCLFVRYHLKMLTDILTDTDRFWEPTFHIPLYIQFVREDSPLAVGARLLQFLVLIVSLVLLN